MKYKYPSIKKSFSLSVKDKLTKGDVVGSVSKVLTQSQLKSWEPESVKLKSKIQICRGITRTQLNYMLKMKELTQIDTSILIKTKVEDVEHSDIGRQVIRGGILICYPLLIVYPQRIVMEQIDTGYQEMEQL